MKSSVEHLNPTRVKITVEVPFDELKPQFDKAYKALAGQVRVPGFRPGKVPARILDARLGRGTILTEVVNDAVPEKYGEAVTEAKLAVLGQPNIEVTRIDDGDALAFTAEVDVRPELDLPDLTAIAVSVDDVEVSDADVEEQVEALRERFATVTPAERVATDGDLVVLDLSATLDGEELSDASAEALSYTVGSDDLVEGLDEAVLGQSAGETVTFTTQLVAGPYANQDVEVRATVVAVNDRTLPEVDDEFAQLASEFDTVDEMRADLADKVRRSKNLQQGTDARDKVLDALVEATEIPVPEAIVEAEVDARQHDAVHAFDHDEDEFNSFLEDQGKSRETFDEETRTAALRAVKIQLLLDALAEAENIEVSQQEFTDRVIFNAQQMGLAPDDYFRRLTEANQFATVFAEVRRGKALASAVEKATITDASGTKLDIAALFGVEDVPETAEGDTADNGTPDSDTAESDTPDGDTPDSDTADGDTADAGTAAEDTSPADDAAPAQS